MRVVYGGGGGGGCKKYLVKSGGPCRVTCVINVIDMTDGLYRPIF